MLDILVDRVRRAGPLHFSEFMATALYDPEHGYYAAGAVRTGWSGDFVTSPELDDAFGALWARGVHQTWEASGRPERFDIFEIGPGEGAFAASILGALPADLGERVRYHLIERVPGVRDRQRALLGEDPRTRWIASFEEAQPVDIGVILGNEILDNVPVDLVEIRDGTPREVLIGERNGALHEVLGDAVSLPRHLDPTSLEPGHRLEIRRGARPLLQAAGSVLRRGAAIFIDYGYPASDIAARPWGTLVAYSRLGADDRVLETPGSKDITAHVDWAALADDFAAAGFQAHGPVRQSDALKALGASHVDASLKDAHAQALAEKRGADALAHLSRRHALRALLDPGGLGRLEVMMGLKAIEAPRFIREA